MRRRITLRRQRSTASARTGRAGRVLQTGDVGAGGDDQISGNQGHTYRDAGVDIDAGNALVSRIAAAARATDRAGVVGGLGGFGGLFDLKAAGYQDPLLVAATDGVGTKLRIAIETGQYGGIGQDLVAMCVNDLVVQGAEPLFFLDYFATGKLAPDIASAVIEGIAGACADAGCALIGGEAAEMPGMYADGDFDLAGFAVGAVERGRLLTGDGVQPGDVVLGLASSGAHSNGFSLVRRLVTANNHAWIDPAPFDPDQQLGAALLTPTRLYVGACLAALARGGVRALAHITGGGLIENIPRVLPDGTAVSLDLGSWTPPAVFGWLAEAGTVTPLEMARTFNCGIGMVAIVAPEKRRAVTQAIESVGDTVYRIGEVVAGGGSVTPSGDWPAAWPATTADG